VSVRTHLARLIEAAETPSVMVQAERAPFSKKELLRARGYRWNPDGPFWQIELPPERVEYEKAWGYRSGLPAMTARTITACERHR
jgi:DNA polymerase-3 subunit epsilon